MTQFEDIRPFYDQEVPAVLARLLADDEFVEAMAKLKFGGCYSAFSSLFRPVVRWFLARQLSSVRTVDQFQVIVKRYMDEMVESATSGFTVSGLDLLDPEKPYLFMSNHRDITLDPAFVNYALYHNGHETVRIAIGDNLLTKPFVSDLMRINKSFIVKRSAKGPRQILAAYKALSGYIRHSIDEDNNPIWIAQREGRAKDGNDRTEPAIIKMLAMSQDKANESFSDYINMLHIVPVSISYELDPCDGAKARELYQTRQSGKYEKGEHEDVASIALGISGQKGAVHVAFGRPLQGEFNDADSVAEAIDQQVITNYKLHPTNYFAYKQLHGELPALNAERFSIDGNAGLQRREQQFQARISALPEAHREVALGIYANIIHQKQALGL